MTIRSVGVLGAGTMGAQIALQIANAGVPCVLLDILARGRGARADAREASQARPAVHA